MEQNGEGMLAEVRRGWKEKDSTPLIAKFDNGVGKM